MEWHFLFGELMRAKVVGPHQIESMGGIRNVIRPAVTVTVDRMRASQNSHTIEVRRIQREEQHLWSKQR